jgi:hypothetical protein
MKAMYFHAAAALALTFAIAACVPSAEPPAAAPPPPASTVPAPTPTPPPPPPPVIQEPVFDNYLDAPQTPGTWTYVDEPSESLAMFGDRPDAPVFIIRCAGGQIALARTVRPSRARARLMSITTETASRQLEATPVDERPLAAAMLAPRDPLLDAMAITKGRFAVGVEGEPTLYLPAWAEVTRVIEDCR